MKTIYKFILQRLSISLPAIDLIFIRKIFYTIFLTLRIKTVNIKINKL